jgi:hypothetical protein
MSKERTFIVRMNHKNYFSWEFQFQMFVKGKELWNHLDGSFMVLADPIKLGSWESKDPKVVSWLLSSMESHMVNNFCSFNTAKEMWDLLRWMYHQDNSA